MAKYDIYLQGRAEEGLDGFKSLSFGFSRTIAVRGPYKLAIAWLKRFLTLKNSDPLRPDDGTEFTQLIGSNVTVEADIRDVLMLTIDDCNTQIVTAQEQNPPDLDEQLLTATLERLEVYGGDGFDAWVNVQNAAGAAVTVQLPTLATRA